MLASASDNAKHPKTAVSMEIKFIELPMKNHFNKVMLGPAAQSKQSMGQRSLGWLNALFAHSRSQNPGAGKAMSIIQC